MDQSDDCRDPWAFWADTGGTFTDCLARNPAGELKRTKVLSSSSLRASLADFGDGHHLQLELGQALPDGFFAGFTLRFPKTGEARMVARFDAGSSTVEVTRAFEHPLTPGDLCVLDFDGEAPELAARLLSGTPGDRSLPPQSLRLASTRGTNALLERKGGRVALFVNRGFADLLTIGSQQRPDLFALEIVRPRVLQERVVEVGGRLDAEGEIVEDFDNGDLDDVVDELIRDGVNVAAVALLHAFRNPVHEQALKDYLYRRGFRHVSLSSALSPLIKLLPRAETALVDAYLTPVLNAYLDSLENAFDPESMRVMTSAGGLVGRGAFHPKDSLFSGPAGGVVGATTVARSCGFDRVIGFDMGGTSTDVFRYDAEYSYQYETRIGDVRLMAPSLRIETVAAGGGSIAAWDGTQLKVGPESAGANPGPACYGTGGPLTVTDINLLLGRMDAGRFGIPVSRDASAVGHEELRRAVPSEAELPHEAFLAGLLEMANQNMANAIRRISTLEGYAPSEYVMVAFGGAGGQHACSVADQLGMKRILVPGDAGILSAFGLRHARQEGIAQRQLLRAWKDVEAFMTPLVDELAEEARCSLPASVCKDADVDRVLLGLRLPGQESPIEVAWTPGQDMAQAFARHYEQLFAYTPGLEALEAVTVRVFVTLPGTLLEPEAFQGVGRAPRERMRQAAFSEGELRETPVFIRSELQAGMQVSGPAIIQDAYSTLFVDASWAATVGDRGSVLVEKALSGRIQLEVPEAVRLELFTNRFKSLVEDMGMRLQRTAVSTNVKERLDFSCALLDAEGQLVVNAPHIPVHLGALGTCVREVGKHKEWQAGSMVVTNHPGFGGSHLPDVTVIAPVHDDEGMLLGFVANRAHHAEMGGIAPGSMPPNARNLEEEGVVIAPTMIMRDGRTDLQPVAACLTGARFPTRRLDENLADFKAQVAANLKGKNELLALARQHGSETIRSFMEGIQKRSERALRDKLKTLPECEFKAVQCLDDGSPIQVLARVEGGGMSLDFSGSAEVHSANFNATTAIVNSAVLYALRLWLDEPIPLNEGLMRAIDLKIPEGMLNPAFPEDLSSCPPVVAGNVETSQRLVDTLLLALGVAACSQGTMNNLIFGNSRISFYETISGGSGAGPGYQGCDGVHSHMTNTAITDPEILEQRFPVRLRCFTIRRGSGGRGAFRGGDGVIREVEFLEAVTVSLLTQHRKERPYGCEGGEAGALGEQWLIRKNGNEEALPSCCQLQLQAGERIRILSPGGGAWGEPGS